MAQKNPKIVFFKEEVDGRNLAAASVKSADVVDAFEIMQTDFKPEVNTVPVNDQGKFFVANLSETEAKELAGADNVVGVYDDIDVFALEGTPPEPREEDEPSYDDFGAGTLERDPEDIEAFREIAKEIAKPKWEPEYEQQMSEQFKLYTQLEPSLEDGDIEAEHRLLEGAAEPMAEMLGPPGVPKEKIVKLIKCIFKCIREQEGAAEEVSDEDVESALRATGMDEETTALAGDYILPNIRKIFAPHAWRYSMGSGVRVAVVDTGIDSRHPDLRVYGGVSYVPGISSWRDDHSHGTHCAGIIGALLNGRGIVGVAPHARLYAVKVLDRSGRGKLSWILNGLMWCYRYGMHVVNLSLGSNVPAHDSPCLGAYEHVGRILRRRGILCVAAAGNNYGKPVGNPARCLSYMAVSAIDCRYRFAPFSSMGPQVEICAPGVSILSTVPGGYGRKSGTSMACPHVAGVAALVKARHPAWHGDHIRRCLWKTAFDLGSPGRDWFFGFGMVDAYRAVRCC